MKRRLPLLFLTALLAAAPCAGEVTFFRAINLNGPALVIDGRLWEGREAPDFVARGDTFENQNVKLVPVTDEPRARMIRSSAWGAQVSLELSAVPDGAYQVALHVWEDNASERFSVQLNGRTVVAAFDSGAAGAWKRLGPFPVRPEGGKITLSAAGGGSANFSGLEVWSGEGEVPRPGKDFVKEPTPEQATFFREKVQPVLEKHCLKCHSATSDPLRGGLLLDSRAGLVRGGESGAVVAPGLPESSRLIEAVKRADEGFAMPPDEALPAEAVAVLEQWVREGAPDPRGEDTPAVVEARAAAALAKARDWWSLRPVTLPAAPEVADKAWPAGEIDLFTLAKMEAAGLRPVGDAEKPALLRRATYDLTGLPPTPEELAAFLADESADAFEKVVDRLLASPRYGERWGRHWLDVVRYADTAGDNSDFPVPQMHRYRDWVIDALNRDLPYDEFVREQLAGDLLGGTGEEWVRRVVATGYIANSRRFGSRVDDYPQHLTIEDTLDNVGRTFLGLTLNCARCHDHKFDPVTTRDYYALYGIFSSTRYPWPGIELEQRQRDFVALVPPDRQPAFQEQLKRFDDELRRLEAAARTAKQAFETAPPEEKPTLEAVLNAAEAAANAHRATKPAPETAYAVAEGAAPGDAAVQVKGDPARPGATVERGFPAVLGGQKLPPEEKGSGRRELAEWIVSADNPLTARVVVNRVWHHHFGRGLVPTPNDFGRQGMPPTHPELLDLLATRLREDGWSLKRLHRRIMFSRTWRLASVRSDEALTKDPGNTWLSAFPRRRIDAESLRDTLLVLGGNLDLSPAGAHPFPPERDWKFTQHNPFKALYESDRRSVYLMTQRIQRHPYLAIFDGADPSTSTPARPTSTTPVQALFLLNDPFVHRQAVKLAERTLAAPGDDTTRLRMLSERCFARPAEDAELEALQAFLSSTRERLHASGTSAGALEREAWTACVRVLFRLNEFVYLD